MIRPEEQSDGELLRRMGAGDEAAFRAIYCRSQGPIYRFALHMTGNPSIAEDVTQEVFMFLIQEAGRFDPSRGTLTGYLFGIGRNMLSRRLEKERPFVPLPENEAFSGNRNGSGNGNGHHCSSNGSGNGSSNGHKTTADLSRLVSPPADFIRGEEIGRVRQAVLSLPTNYREAVVLCDLQEMSYEEAAKVLECAVGTVRSRLHRARALLVEKLREFHNPMQKPVAIDYRSREGRS